MPAFTTIEPGCGARDVAPCPLTDRDIHVWAYSLAARAGDLARWMLLLSDDERRRAGRFRRAADADAYIVAHGGMRQLLSSYCVGTPRALRFTRAAGDKPVLDAAGGGPAIHFSLAHCSHGALLAVSRSTEVGVDLEAARSDIDPTALAAQFFCATERDAIAAAPPAFRTDAFFRHWVAKEAVLKARGTGLACPLDAFALRFSATGDVAGVAASAAFGRSDWLVLRLPLPKGWYGALCAPENYHVRLLAPMMPRA